MKEKGAELYFFLLGSPPGEKFSRFLGLLSTARKGAQGVLTWGNDFPLLRTFHTDVWAPG